LEKCQTTRMRMLTRKLDYGPEAFNSNPLEGDLLITLDS